MSGHIPMNRLRSAYGDNRPDATASLPMNGSPMAEVSRTPPTTHERALTAKISLKIRSRRTFGAKQLAHLEVGSAFLLEGQRPFLCVVGQEHLDTDRGIDLERVVLVHALGLVDRLQDRLNG